MNIKTVLLAAAFFLISSSAFSQEKQGSLEIIKDPLIERLQQSRIAFTTAAAVESSHTEGKPKGTRGTALGFRVQIYSGPSRNEAYAAQARFQQQYENIATYVSYTQPNYRVKVGDFRSRSEAQAFMREVKKSFPTVFLFTEQVVVYY
jgi:hypothetical protein